MNEDRANFIDTLNQLALAYMEMSSHSEALPHLEKALQIASAEPSHGLMVTLTNLGTVYRHMRELPTAIKYSKQALDVFQQLDVTNPSLRLTYSICLGNLGALYRLSRNFIEAERFLKEALATCSVLPDVPIQEVGNRNFSLGLLYMDLHDYTTAQPYLETALELTRTGLGETRLEYAVQLNALGIWNRLTGNLATAVRMHEQVTAIYRQTYGLDHPLYATNLDCLARLYVDMTWYTKAEAALREAIAILQAKVGENHEYYLQSLHNLGTALAHQSRFIESFQVTQRVLKLTRKTFGENSSMYAAGLHNLVVILPKLSEEHILAALAEFIMVDEPRPTVHDSVDVFLNLVKKGYPALQAAFLEKIATIEHNIGIEQSSSYATTLVSLGMTYLIKGDMDQAETSLRRALKIERKLGHHPRPELALVLNALADFYVATGRAGKAFVLMQKANRIENYLVGQVFTTGSELQRMQYFLVLRRNFYVFLSLIKGHFANVSRAVEAAFDLTLQRKALGAEALAAQRDAALGGHYPELAPKLREWQRVRTQIAQKTLAGPGAEGEECHRKLLSEWNDRKEVLEIELAQHIPEMNLQKKLKTANWQSVATALPAESRLIEFVLFEEFNFAASPATDQWQGGRYLAFVLSPVGPAKLILVDLGAGKPIDRLIAAFRAAIIGVGTQRDLTEADEPVPKRPEEARKYGQKLRELIFDPLLPFLGEATRLFLATDGDLTRLPFEALPLNLTSYVINRYKLSYLSSGRDLLRLGQSLSNRQTQPLVMADPDFDFDIDNASAPAEVAMDAKLSHDLLRSNFYFTRLQGTRREGEEVARLLGVAPLLDRAALEQRLKSISSPLVLHIATHGFFLPNQTFEPGPEESAPGLAIHSISALAQARGGIFSQKIENPLLRSGLALAGANRTLKGKSDLPVEVEDGLLTAEDVTALDLLNTEMVVLSACETGLGDVLVGEGVYGLQRSIILAGAKTLVMSLWKVPDYQTQELMIHFYERLLQGVPRSDALRQAQLVLKEKYTYPFYWGAFICYGDPNVLKLKK